MAACILFDRSKDVYSDPGSPMMRKTSTGTNVIARKKMRKGLTFYLMEVVLHQNRTSAFLICLTEIQAAKNEYGHMREQQGKVY